MNHGRAHQYSLRLLKLSAKVFHTLKYL